MQTITWRAYYDDGSELWQYNPGTEQKSTYADIERRKLVAFALFQENRPLVMVDFRDDSQGDSAIGPKRLVWRIRHMMDTKGSSTQVHLVGWQRAVNGRNVQSICFVAEDGVIVLGGQWQEDLPLRGAIAPLPCEADLIT